MRQSFLERAMIESLWVLAFAALGIGFLAHLRCHLLTREVLNLMREKEK